MSLKCAFCAKHCISCFFSLCDSEANYELVDSQEDKTKSKIDCLKFSLEQSRKLIDSFLCVFTRTCTRVSWSPGCTACSPLIQASAQSPQTTISVKAGALSLLVPEVAEFLFTALFLLCSHPTDGVPQLPLSVALLRMWHEQGVALHRSGPFVPCCSACLLVTTVAILASAISRRWKVRRES